MRRPITKNRPQQTTDPGGLIPPDQLFDHPLPRLFIIDAERPFEERVERAWQRILATRFTPEEHERLREVLVGIITHGSGKNG